ncbi:MAG TPA: 1-acyl-sn-glycerol-3-phosphate acyltransferase [Parachlamydiaceae bacterium]|nr:1-acyl-sn-glycerol-3-phosphate acyltransferase [Parachlamydiaceae bacterium]
MRAKIEKFLNSCRDYFNNFVFSASHSILIPMRYKVEIKGAECLDIKNGGVNSSILFLANHSSHIDATIIGTTILKKHMSLSIWALDLTFKLPYLRWAARHKESIQVVKVPNINERRSEKHTSNLHKLVSRTGDGLLKGKNFLIFPAGRCKNTPVEKIDGKSAIPLIIQQYPEVNIILVRVTGLWGSRFSCATKLENRWATRSIRTLDMFWQSLKMVLLNGIFFIPKRKILVEFIPAALDFPRHGSRLEIDRYLENKFNENWGPEGEPLYRVPDYFWKDIYTNEHQYLTKKYVFNLNLVPKYTRNAIVTLLADKADMDCKDVDFKMHLGRDLGLDSLDLVEVLSEMEKRYHIKRLVPEDLTTVGHLIAIAAKIPIVCEVEKGLFHKIEEHKSFKFSQLFIPIKSLFSSIYPQ